MLPGEYPMELYRGDTGSWQFVLWQDAAHTVPANLTGVTPTAQVRNKPDGTTIIAFSCSVAAPNIINMSLSASDAALLPKRGSWDLQLNYPGGVIRTILAGPVSTVLDTTKP